MKGFVVNLEKETESNINFRKVIYTAAHSQLVLMSLKPSEDIGEEVHTLDQFIRIEEGQAEFVLNGVEHKATAGYAVVIPAGVKHNVINTSAEQDLKIYTIYSPAEHQDGVVRASKEQAMANEEHFDGKLSEAE